MESNSHQNAIELFEEMLNLLPSTVWHQLYAKEKTGEKLTVQQQGERSAYNHGVFKAMECMRAWLNANIRHHEQALSHPQEQDAVGREEGI